MSYNHEDLPKYVRTAGKITMVTAIAGFCVFIFAFVFDFGAQELNKVSAQYATTTLTVLNTPPEFQINAYEFTDSTTTSPINSGDSMEWRAMATDSNGAPYFLLICSDNASPTADWLNVGDGTGIGEPRCATPDNPVDTGTAIQWGVSTSTLSGAIAIVSTTTSEVGVFTEEQDWYAWVCDDDFVNPRCNNIAVQGPTTTTSFSSPWNMNYRPQLINFYNNGPADPGGTITFFSTSSDPDTVGGSDDIFITVCSDTDYATSTNTCVNYIASSTVGVAQDASVVYNVQIPTRDQTYQSYAWIYDEHGHVATGSIALDTFVINNVPPVIQGGNIDLYGAAGPGSDIVLSVEAGETLGSSIEFLVSDDNSCDNTDPGFGGEITGYVLSVFRSDVGTTTCDGSGSNYNPNYCYESGLATTTWNLSCSATTTCLSATQTDMEYLCDFPLWFVADPTDELAVEPGPYASSNWSVGIAGVDDDFATGTMATTSNPKELLQFNAFTIDSAEIVYGSLEPGDDSQFLGGGLSPGASSTMRNTGNTALDQEVEGESMCGTFSSTTTCPVSATSTIPENLQQFSSTSLPYGDALAKILSSSTPTEVELNIASTTATSTYSFGKTYWGILVPGTITLAGSYRGLNTYTAKTAETADW